MVGSYLSIEEEKALEKKKARYQAEQDQYKVQIAEYQHWIAQRNAYIDAQSYSEPSAMRADPYAGDSYDDVAASAIVAPEPEVIHLPDPPPVPRAPQTEKPQDPNTLTPSNWAGAIGLGNGFVLAVLAWIWKRKEDLEGLRELSEDVFKGENDLSKLSVKERTGMMIRSWFNSDTHARYHLRKDRGWSVYSALCGIIDVPASDRPFFVVNRQQRPWDEIIAMFGELNPSNDVDQVRMHEMAFVNKRAVDLGLWKISLAFDDFASAVADTAENEYVIFIAVKDENNAIKYHTLTSDEAYPPNCLESWELFVDAFRSKFYYEDKSAYLELIVVGYVPV
jgi:hypothetical protein